MSEHFLTNITIEQFKCFSSFKAEGFKRVNLIGGKNNVGKTAFIEACYINVFSLDIKNMISSIVSIKGRREKANLVYEDIKAQSFLDSIRRYEVISNIKAQQFSVWEGDGKKEYQFDIDGKSASINAKEINISMTQAGNIDFIDSFGRSDIKLIKTFQTIQKLDKENELNNFVNEFDSSIESFKVIGDKPQCKVNGEYLDLTEFGDGLKHYISIICGLYACENGYLFIDEIGNGIHYTQHDKLWELILTISEQTKCQVFAITHSKEMLESFARVAKKLNEQDISYTTLVKNKQGEIKAIAQDYEMLFYSLSQEHEVR